MRTHLVGATLIALFGSAAGAAAQEPDVIFYSQAALDPAGGQVRTAGPMGQIRIAGGPGVPFEMGVDVLAVEPFDTGKPVAGAPYSAEITTEIVQQLADGNRIERRSTSSVARDGQGRLRREQQVTAIGPILPQGHAQIVTINDPVAKAHYSLDAERKVAIQMPMLFTAKVEGPAGRSFPARAETREFIAGPPVAAAQATDARTEMLGTKEIEGVRAEGTRVTVAIPAGAIGNQAPIEIVHERWYRRNSRRLSIRDARTLALVRPRIASRTSFVRNRLRNYSRCRRISRSRKQGGNGTRCARCHPPGRDGDPRGLTPPERSLGSDPTRAIPGV